MNSVAIAPAFIHASIKRRKNVWYSQKDGNWSDPSTWESNAIKRYNYPGQTNVFAGGGVVTPDFPNIGDEVYISHTVTLDKDCYINNLYITGTFKVDAARVLVIYGDLQSSGIIDFTGKAPNLYLNGYNNQISTFLAGNSTVFYSRRGDQPILPLTYAYLYIEAIGPYNTNTGINPGSYVGFITKHLTGDVMVLNDLTSTGATNNTQSLLKIELGSNNLTVTGTTYQGNRVRISKASSVGTTLFIGNVTLAAANWEFAGNADVEFRGGINVANNIDYFNSGTGTYRFTTNNQSIKAGYNYSDFSGLSFNAAILVVNITLTNIDTGGGPMVQINNSLNGTTAQSAFVNKGVLYMNTPILPMTTGSIDKDTYNTNIMGYVMNGNQNIPYQTYQGLYLAGTGIKSFTGDTYISTTFQSAQVAGTAELGSYNLTVNSTTNLNNTYTLSKNGSGNVLFIGKITLTGTASFNFTGNPNVEFRNGWEVYTISQAGAGNGQYSFTTNNQTIKTQYPAVVTVPNILISGAITLTLAGSGQLNTSNITGNNAASTFIIGDGSNPIFIFNGINAVPMPTGVINFSSNSNAIRYEALGNQDILAGTYKYLILGGTGVKTLLGNVSVQNAFTLTPPATLNTNGFALTNP